MWKNIIIGGLGFGLLCTIGHYENKIEEGAKDRLHLFGLVIDLAQDVLKLQNENSKLKEDRA